MDQDAIDPQHPVCAPLPVPPEDPPAAAVLALGTAGMIEYPSWVSAARNGNESAAIATLKNVSAAQSKVQASGVLDADANGRGEYGFFGEMAGVVPLRGSDAWLTPPVLSNAFGGVLASRVVRGGYVFQMFLPDARVQGVGEDASGGDPAGDNGVAAGGAEVLWCCYAWPQRRGRTGLRSFFINQCGDGLATNGAVAPSDGDARPCT